MAWPPRCLEEPYLRPPLQPHPLLAQPPPSADEEDDQVR